MQKRIGELLLERRTAMGASLQDVEGATLIRAAYLGAVEKGDYSAIPGEIYVKLYVKSYASFLGMDPNQAALMLDREMAEAKLAEVTQEKIIPPSETSMDKRMLHRIKMEQLRRQKARRRTLVTAAVIFFLALIVLAAWLVFGGKSDEAGMQQALAPQAGEQSVPPADVQPGTEPHADEVPPVAPPVAPPSVPSLPHNISINFTDDCWIRVYADGKREFEGMKRAGEELTLSARLGIWMRIGNAGGVKLTYNGKDMGVPGGARNVMDLAFPAGYGPF